MRYRILRGGYVDETGVHRGVPPTEQDFQRIALMFMHRTLFTCDLQAHLDTMSTENAKRAYKAMESCADAAGKYFFDPPSKALIKEGPKAMVLYEP